MLAYWLALGHPKAATGHLERHSDFAKSSVGQYKRYSSSITSPFTSTGSGAPPLTWIRIAG